jgi:hypothetical protein
LFSRINGPAYRVIKSLPEDGVKEEEDERKHD